MRNWKIGVGCKMFVLKMLEFLMLLKRERIIMKRKNIIMRMVLIMNWSICIFVI